MESRFSLHEPSIKSKHREQAVPALDLLMKSEAFLEMLASAPLFARSYRRAPITCPGTQEW
jgi:hypothetical protein